MTPAIQFNGDQMLVHFDRFDLEAYRLFLRVKTLPEYRLQFHEESETWTVSAPARFAQVLGIESPASALKDLPLSPFLFDDQVEIIRNALAAKRYAVWSDCGLGKTACGLEFARHVIHRTGGRVLIFTLNEIVNQWLDEAAKFYGSSLPIHKLETRAAMKQWARYGAPGLAVTNYEKLNYAHEGIDGQVVREFQSLAGVILDEGSRLKTQAGKQKWVLIKSCEQIEYKLVLTATPAPNDVFEFASQAGFLNKFRAEDSINAYFRRDNTTHRWTIKPHAREAFFRFMASWSIYVRDPRRYGWRKNVPDVPPPIVQTVPIAPTSDQIEWLHRLSAVAGKTATLPGMQSDRETNAIQRAKLSQVAKGFAYRKGEGGAFDKILSNKPATVADLIRSEAGAGRQVLVWTVFDAESQLLAEALGQSVEFELLTGKTKRQRRIEILEAFRRGETRVLISRAAMLGYGMNLQFCTSMIFSGWSDCYSEDTEILTRRGWLTFGNVTLDDEVASINPVTRHLEWQEPSRLIWQRYKGPMLHFTGERNFDLLVTPNHKLFVQRCPLRHPGDSGEWHLKYAAEIADRFRRQEYRMMSAADGFAGARPDSISVPLLNNGPKSHPTRVVREMPVETFMRLAGWYLTEGYCRPLDSEEAGRIVICQTETNAHHRAEIIGLLKSLGLNVNAATKDITSYSTNLSAFLIREFGSGSHFKRIPEWVKDMDRPLLAILRDTMLKGDGCHQSRHAERASFYRTASKQLADDFQEICLKTGIRGSVHYRAMDYELSGGPCWDVSVAWENVRPAIHKAPLPVEYDGMIGCVTVPNHVIIVRRNGIPVVSGNSYEQWYQAIRRAYRYGQTESLRVFLPVVTELEGDMLDNIFRKQADHEAAIAEMERNYVLARKEMGMAA